MNRRLELTARGLCALLVTGSLVSCEDKALVRENEALLEQIAESEARVTALEAEEGEDPGDQTGKLEQLKKRLGQAEAELADLRDAREKMTAENEKAAAEFQQYKTRYPIR